MKTWTMGCVVTLLLAFTGCSDSGGPDRDGGSDGKAADLLASDRGKPDLELRDLGPDAETAPILDNTHKGWAKTTCSGSGCHTLPLTGHPTDLTPDECAHCHGANGACDPNGINSGYKSHTRNSTCTGCHQTSEMHGFTPDEECISCHFAARGLQNCK